MTSVSHVTAMYATKRRRRNSKNVKPVSKDVHTKSNPSKRHRERLNQELDTLASLLPFEQNVLSKLDKLSILRLSVSYLRTKSYFQAALSGSRLLTSQQQQQQQQQQQSRIQQEAQQQQTQLYQRQLLANSTGCQQQLDSTQSLSQPQTYPPELRIEGDLIVQALNGFLLILTCDGEVFYASHTVEAYLGFHQSDICHQSVYELVHSEDREELMRQLKWNSMIARHQQSLINGQASSYANSTCTTTTTTTTTATTNQNNNHDDHNNQANSQIGASSDEHLAIDARNASHMSIQEILASPEHRHLLERNFTVRFRCLLDNTSGFLRLDIRGRIKVLHGQHNQHSLANSACPSLATKKHQHQQQQQQAQLQPQMDSTDAGAGLNSGQPEPMLAFFGVCIPFGPPAILEMPTKDSVFKSKHRLDMSLISLDSRGRQLLGLVDLTIQNKSSLSSSLANVDSSSPDRKAAALGTKLTSISSASGGGVGQTTASSTPAQLSSSSSNGLKQSHNISAYDLVHHDDLSYMALAHQELLKTGASGLIAYRVVTRPEGKLQWLQTSAKLYYKNSKPDFILCTHRPLMEEEGRDLLGKRTMDFKITFLNDEFSSINERIMACDKFSSIQTLGCSGAKSLDPTANVLINGNNNSNCHRQNNNNNHSISSPALSGESSRSLASLSPQSTSPTDHHGHSTHKSAKSTTSLRRKYNTNNYDPNNLYHESFVGAQQPADYHHLTSQQYAAATFESPYKRIQTGEVYYDLDTTITSETSESLMSRASTKYPSTGSGQSQLKKRNNISKQAANCKSSSIQIKTDLGIIDGDLTDQQQQQQQQQQQMMLLGTATGDPHSRTSMKKASSYLHKDDSSLSSLQHSQNINHHHQHQHQYQQHQSQYQHQSCNVDPSQQLHLYSQYNHSHDSESYPVATQAAAAYAAVASHHHHHHHHQSHNPYGSAINHHLLSYGNHHQNSSASQSLYGSSVASMMSPTSSGAFSAHNQHPTHSQLHHQHNLDSSASGHHFPAVAHYGSLSSAHVHQQAAHQIASANAAGHYPAASSFLPAEHLLHHYSQSAARSAALAAWQQPQSGATNSAASLNQSSSSSSSDYQSGNMSSHSVNQTHAAAAHQSMAPTPTDYATGSSSSGAAAAASASATTTASASASAAAANPTNVTNETIKREPEQASSTFSPSRSSSNRTNETGYTNANTTNDQHYSQSPSSSVVEARSSPKSSSARVSSKNGLTSGAIVGHRMHQTTGQNQKTNATPSLGSDGSLHRSPLSSGESSNGSIGNNTISSATHPAAMIASNANNTPGRDLSMLSPSAYYGLGNEQQAQQHNSISNHQATSAAINHQQSRQTQSAATSAHSSHSGQQQQQALASYQNPYAAAAVVAHQYAQDAQQLNNYHQHHYQNHQHHHHHHQHQSSIYAADNHDSSGYFQHHSSGDLSMVGSGAVTTPAMKLYVATNDQYNQQCTGLVGQHQQQSVKYGLNYAPLDQVYDQYQHKDQQQHGNCAKSSVSCGTDRVGYKSNGAIKSDANGTTSLKEWPRREEENVEPPENNNNNLHPSRDMVAGAQQSKLDDKSTFEAENDNKHTKQPDKITELTTFNKLQTRRENSTQIDADECRDPLAQLISSTIGDISIYASQQHEPADKL